jgi:hypothetical protein
MNTHPVISLEGISWNSWSIKLSPTIWPDVIAAYLESAGELTVAVLPFDLS